MAPTTWRGKSSSRPWRADRDLDPIARGLEAIAVGYSQRFPDDVENLAHQFEVYDALYAWCRLQAAKEG